MLKSEELDRDGFEEILQRAIVKIPQIYPEWTDFNPTDPGIMLLELMSYFTEVSEYHLNVIDEDNYRKYLKLLGKVPEARQPAKSWLKITGNGRLPENSVFFAEEIPFETEYEIDVNENEIVSVKSGDTVIENKNNLFGDLHSKLVFSPFDDRDEAGDYGFEIHLKKPLYPGNTVGIYIQIKEWKNTSPFQDGFPDYVKFHCEILDNVWKHGVEILVDETRGFCRSGIIIFRVAQRISVGEGREIRFLIDEGEYPVKPVITGIIWNVVPARQKITSTDTVDLGMTYGICNQHIKFDVKNCIPQSIKLSVLEKNGRFQWECVESFDDSEPLSRHFRYEEKNGEIIFGDGVYGRTPKGRVLIEGYETSYGEAGNIRETVLTCLPKWQAVNILPAVGGRNPQSLKECFEEIKNGNDVTKRCVTLEDYEKAAKNTPGVPVYRVRAFRDRHSENTICIAVQGAEKELNRRCIDNLKQYILPKAMLGTNVEFVKPKYTRLYVFLEISVHAYYEKCEEKTIDAVKKYFDSEEISFGAYIRGNQIISHLYGLPWIKGIRNLEITSSGNRGNTGNGRDVRLDEDCLPYVDSVTVHITG